MDDLRKKFKLALSNQNASYIYTYPFKKAYLPITDWKSACASWHNVSGPLALYLHIPFCEMKCAFCSLFSVTRQPQDLIERYTQALLQEIEIMKPYLDLQQLSVKSVYFGGGTPTLLNEQQLSLIIEKIRTTFHVEENAEWSIEGAPNTYTQEKLQYIKNLGFNRVSIGIQSFIEEELRQMGRRYGADLGPRAAIAAAEAGIFNINLDLIRGIPTQNLDNWRFNLERAISFNPRTITVYPLTVRDNTGFGKKGAVNSSTDEWYDYTVNQLSAQGYHQHTLVTFAKQGGGCGHEAQEFTGVVPTLSFGAGARKYAPYFHYSDEDYAKRAPSNVVLHQYIEAIEKGTIPVRSAVSLSHQDWQIRRVILGLLSSGVERDAYPILNNLLKDFTDPGTLRLNREGLKYSSQIGHFIAEEYETILGR